MFKVQGHGKWLNWKIVFIHNWALTLKRTVCVQFIIIIQHHFHQHHSTQFNPTSLNYHFQENRNRENQKVYSSPPTPNCDRSTQGPTVFSPCFNLIGALNLIRRDLLESNSSVLWGKFLCRGDWNIMLIFAVIEFQEQVHPKLDCPRK
jgi:hypothetical protein